MLRKGGEFVCTFMDGKSVVDSINANGGDKVEGRKKLNKYKEDKGVPLWAIIRRYDNDVETDFKKKVDVYIEATKKFIPEFIVNFDVLVRKCKEYNLEFVDSELFSQTFNKIKSKYLNTNVKKNNITNLDFNDNTFDYILCIATFHHLLSDTDKNKGMKEIIRVMKSGAIGIITCWSTEQPEDSKFNFHDGINIVMWKGRQDLNKTRYYYVYNYTMFLEFFTSFVEIEIIKIYNEVGNWILLFKKK
jgi:SAM-dependent methyltransferase